MSQGVDPTDAQYASILLPNRSALEVAAYAAHSPVSIVFVDPSVTVLQQSPTLKLRVDVNGAKGKTFHAPSATGNDN